MAANTPHLVYHWEKIDTGVEAYTTTTTTSDIFLLVQDSPEWIRQKVQVLLDGPYGYNAHPEMYETVVLVAQGRGIAGVLPAASHIARISRRSRITRRIDLQWKLDQNDDEEWAEERLQNLIHLDPHRVRNDTSNEMCHMIVMACGDPNFTGDIQRFVFQLPTLATFSRIDFQAGSGKKVSTRDIVYVPNTTV
ncbi:Ferric/cupric reductase transmembrane component B [Colletotrichum fructicola]|nr:Ferric/cupric reductase transmembrane component B [Colletotrichum fructicola]